MSDRQVLQLPKKCTICDREFARPEHLKRHMSIHDNTKPFVCKYCGKSFGRKDAAQRHEQSHLHRSTPPELTESPLCRTCSSCAKARVKCSGHMPCKFCQNRELACVYRPRKRRRRLYSSTDDQNSDADVTELATSTTHFDEEDDMTMRATASASLALNNSDTALDQAVDTTLTSSSISCAEPGQGRGVSSTASARPPESDAPHVASVNWLPFRRSDLDSIPFSLRAQHTPPDQFDVPEVADPLHLINEESLAVDLAAQRPPIDASTQQNDQFSALIASMLTTSAVFDLESPSTHSGGSRIGRLYADGTGARESRLGRRASHRTRTAASWGFNTLLSNSSWMSILHEKIASREFQESRSSRISHEVHTELMTKISDFLGQNTYSLDYLANKDDLVAKRTWEYLIQLYFKNFHPIYPFLDHSFLGLPSWGWALCLATAAIGARYTAIAELVTYGELLSKTLHDILLRELETGPVDDSLPFLQARAICAISLCQSRRYDLMDLGSTALTTICNSSLRLRLLSEDDRNGEFQQGQDAEQAWIAWRFRETRRRTAYFVLTISANMAFIRGTSPHLNLEDVSLLLPSSEKLWGAETYQQWFQCRSGSGQVTLDPSQFHNEECCRMSLHNVLRSLWVNNSLSQSMSPFTAEAVIHMLIRRIWYAEQYLGDSLFARSEMEDHDPQLQPASRYSCCYPGSNPEFAKWRNATCDCLDIIHWDALSGSARACGFESTVFLSLHLARLLLLTPVKDLLAFAHECAGHPSSWVLPHSLYASGSHKKENSAAVMTWWFQDRYKARLALVHAGAMFWHIRRYASESYMQPFAVYLATVVLWAYGTCANRYLSHIAMRTTEDQTQNADMSLGSSLEGRMFGHDMDGHTPPIYLDTIGANEVQGDARMPSQMQLDRPMDDELVQFFIRHGSIRLLLEGVPDLCGVKGPLQVLQEGSVILQLSADTWTITERYVHSLHDLAKSVETTSWPQTEWAA